MNWKELEKKARQNGFCFVRHRGKHDEYRNTKTGEMIMIERHWSQEVRPGLLFKLKKAIGF